MKEKKENQKVTEMFDIDFYMRVYEFQKKINKGEKFTKEFLLNKFEEMRNKNPVIYNIETTNACNMKCKMCPRTTMMTRSVESLDKETFIKIVDQIKPFTKDNWKKWEEFCQKTYNIGKDDMSENHFFLYIIPKVIQLHGYGDPLLDPNMGEFVRILTQKGFSSYFSCNPANINIKKTIEMFESGLSYIKYSIESVDDETHKSIRGKASNFTESYKRILELLDIKKKKGYKTTIIITMLDLNKPNQKEEYAKLKKAFEGKDVYIYMKSEDQQWYRKDFHGTNSIHWSEICKHPWMSMTIKSNAEVVMCMEDYNNEIVLGDAKKETLYDIWNGPKYERFRKDHFDLTPGLKCTERCDMKMIGEFLNTNKSGKR
ncbi:MAG: radical SAM protein [Nanoarchaeota archaeon]|nr:radical SAM protein [Nanoarchaeota archaeon]